MPGAHVHLEQQRQPAPGRARARSAHRDGHAHRRTDEQAQDRTATSPRGCDFLLLCDPSGARRVPCLGRQGPEKDEHKLVLSRYHCPQPRPATTQARWPRAAPTSRGPALASHFSGNLRHKLTCLCRPALPHISAAISAGPAVSWTNIRVAISGLRFAAKRDRRFDSLLRYKLTVF